jgi:hypothetical protein
MELETVNGGYKNGLGEVVSLENDYVYPLLKSSDVGNGRIEAFRKVVLITQKFVGEDTSTIKKIAPITWKYLTERRGYLDKRRSSIYKNKPEFSIFGIGDYSFKEWKIAISGLYKKLQFNLIGPLSGKPVMFDDTVNFLSFDSEQEAKYIFHLLTSKTAIDFLESMIFWDEKRPITINILRRLSLKEVALELGEIEQYRYWAQDQAPNEVGQMELGIADKKSRYKTIASS